MRRWIGSPPRARGTATQSAGVNLPGGITPACAGNRHGIPLSRSCGADHPRVRGEQSSGTIKQAEKVGSPPRARGTGLGSLGIILCKRITPACAGNSRRPPRRSSHDKDHPRVRGEQIINGIDAIENGGSPPRARGTDLNFPHYTPFLIIVQ